MNSFLSIIKFDYLQRTRSYAFLIILCISLAIAYAFVPEPNATYSTIRVAGYLGDYNAAWFGYVTAIMTSINLFLIGFYLVNDSIKKDIETKVGAIVASTRMDNFSYLLSKVLSNFLVLSTIVLFVFGMSIALFFLYNNGTRFELLQFIKPYLLITFPAMFFVAAIAVFFEVILGRYSVIQNSSFFLIFALLMMPFMDHSTPDYWDVFGTKIVIQEMEELVKTAFHTGENTGVSIGFTIGGIKKEERFNFIGIDFPAVFVISRLLWMLLAFGLVAIVAPFFHRFDLKRRVSTKKETIMIAPQKKNINTIVLSNLSKVKTDFGIFSFIKIELLLLVRNGKKWLWGLNLLGMFSLGFLPITVAHQVVLPILWFLQISRLSSLTAKEVLNNVQVFTATAYRPLARLLLAQLLAGIGLLLFLALPLIARFVITADFMSVFIILLGGVFIVLFAAALGIITKGKKVFEILFFVITYSNLNGIAFTDYYGGLEHDSTYLSTFIFVIIALILISFLSKRYVLLNVRFSFAATSWCEKMTTNC